MSKHITILTHNVTVLLFETGMGWVLPGFTFTGQHFWQDVGHINRAVRERFGMAVTTLNCVAIVDASSDDKTRFYYALVNHSPPDVLPDHARWFTGQEIDTLPKNEQRDVICEWFHFIETSPIPENRAPWYLPGWLAQAQTWIDVQLTRLGLHVAAPIEQIRSWQRASLWKIPTDKGTLYFKAVPGMFHFEPQLTHALAEWLPGRVPRVLAIEPDKHWFLMDSIGKQSLTETSDIEAWGNAARRFAQLQLDLTSRVESLLALGVPDRRLENFPAWIDDLLSDTAMLQQGQLGLSGDEIAHLQELGTVFKDISAQLKESPIPVSLEHGDFWSGQVLLNGENYAFIDWSDCSISHPFLSTWFFLVEVAFDLPDSPGAYSQLRQAYLEPWSQFAPMGQLIDIFELAQLLSPIHHALIYHRLIIPNMENKWEMERMLPNALRKVLGS
ncbi:MAG: phosphotransferase [Chloroflexota bacterium]